MTTLPSTERRHAPDFGSREWFAAHEATHKDPRVTSIDTSADYIREHSHDNGQTWQLHLTSGPWDHVSGHVVRGNVASALLAGWDAVADGPTRILRGEGGRLTRWTLRDDFPYPTA